MKYNKFPEVLEKLLKERRMTQRTLANELNVSAKVVSDWKMGNYIPHIYSLMALADVFNVSLDYLIYGDEVNGR